MLRVANIIEEGKFGGPQVRISLIASSLNGRVQTTVIMPEENSEVFRARCEELGVTYKTFSMSRITKELSVLLRYIFFSFSEVLKITRFLKEGEFDLIHVSGGSWQYKGVISGKLAGVKVVWHLNDTSMPWIIRRLFNFFSRFVDYYIFASERSREYYGSMVSEGKRKFVIPAPVDVAKFNPSCDYSAEEKLIQKWSNNMVIGIVANINPIKGIDVFLQAAALLNKKIESLQFVIIGTIFKNQQEYFKKLNKLCESLSINNVEFVGTRKDVRPLLKRFDVYVCSSWAESSPISVWEAMAMEKPIVSTNVGDVPLYITNNNNGYIVNTGDFESLAARVEHLIIDKDARLEFGKKTREIVCNELELKISTKKTFDCYTTVVKGSANVELDEVSQSDLNM